MIPNNYMAWRHCMEVICKQPLTLTFVQERLKALRHPNDAHTKLLQQHYGAGHVQSLISWFEQAQQTFGENKA
jgi:hypothetical protein